MTIPGISTQNQISDQEKVNNQNNSQKQNDYLTYEQAAEYLGLKLSTLYSKISRKEIPHYRLSGRCVRFNRRELIEWMESHHVDVEKEGVEL